MEAPRTGQAEARRGRRALTAPDTHRPAPRGARGPTVDRAHPEKRRSRNVTQTLDERAKQIDLPRIDPLVDRPPDHERAAGWDSMG